jgi:peptide/nickel transport system substrate-binding protein
MRQIILYLLLGLLTFSSYANQIPFYEPLQPRLDDANQHVAPALARGSHLKVFLPSVAYLYISHAINGALTRPANNTQGWDYDLAVSHQQIDDTTYEFKLREGVVFQNGTPFNADSIISNMKYFKRKPPVYSKIHEVYDRVSKIDDYTIHFHLKEKYGAFMNDVVWIQFYTQDYLLEHGWNGKPTPPNLAAAGLHGLGPYILADGYVEGDRQTAKVELVANPLYWNKNFPKIERVTVYTELSEEQAREMIFYQENQLDIIPLDFNYKIETILSPYAKLLISPSTEAYMIHLNMRTGNPRLLDKDIRVALNQAIHQTNLLRFVYEDEGDLVPALAAPSFLGVKENLNKFKAFSEENNPYQPDQQERLKKVLNGLTLKVLTQEHFLSLWKGIEYQLKKVGVTLEITTIKNQKEIFDQLLNTNIGKNTQAWDLLSWGNDGWFLLHPWSVFMVLRTHNYWSTLPTDKIMDDYLEDLFKTNTDEPSFVEIVYNIMRHASENAYMLFLPAPRKIFAVNKEVIFVPYQQAVLPLWEIELSNRHASLRKEPYPEALKKPVQMMKKHF